MGKADELTFHIRDLLAIITLTVTHTVTFRDFIFILVDYQLCVVLLALDFIIIVLFYRIIFGWHLVHRLEALLQRPLTFYFLFNFI